MKNKIGILFILPLIISCSIPSKTLNSEHANVSALIDKIETVSFGMTQPQVIEMMGKPTQIVEDTNTSTSIFRYTEGVENSLVSRAHFTFEGQPNLLAAKYILIYENDIESKIDFWKKKNPSAQLTIKASSIPQGHYIKTKRIIELSSEKTLIIENNRVVQVYWHRSQ